jgi:RNA recognition motif-containing protein
MDAIPDAGPRENDEKVVEQLRDSFGKYGEITKVNYRGLNYAFVHFTDKAGVEAAVSGGNVNLGGGEVTVEEGKPRTKRSKAEKGQPNTSIYVKDIPENCEDDVIETAFAVYGTISRIANKSARGFAFVTFETEDEMKKAIEASGVTVGGSAVLIEEGRRKGGRGPAPAAE